MAKFKSYTVEPEERVRPYLPDPIDLSGRFVMAPHGANYITHFSFSEFSDYELGIAFEQFTFVATGSVGGAGELIGNIDCDHEQAVYDLYDTIELFTGSFVSGDRTGDVDCDHHQDVYDLYDTIALFTGHHQDDVEEITGDIDCTFEEFGCQWQTGLHLGLTFEPWAYYSAFLIEGEDMDSLSFRPFEMEMYGDSTYVTMELEFELFECAMYVGTSMTLVFEDWTMDIQGVTGYTGSIDLTMRRFEFLGEGGKPAHMDLEFQNFQFTAGSDTGILAGMNLIFRIPTMELSGETPIVGTVTLGFEQFRFDIRTVGYAEPIGNMHLVFRVPVFNMYGIKGIDGDLNTNAINFGIQMSGYSDGPNALELVFEEPEMGAGLEGEDCDLADTLTYTR